MIKFAKIKPGMVLYDYHSQRAASGLRWANWPVRIISIEGMTATVSWNHNPPQCWHQNRLTRLRAKPGKEKGGGIHD